jgi:uncharacterized membrane protein HdeD (DUF308 family)
VSAEFVSGGTAVAAFVIALFFIRYWRQTRDLLFFMFAAGFLTFGISRLILAFLEEDDEGRVFIYALRLIAFALILVAIIHKNRTPPAHPPGPNGNGFHAAGRAHARRYARR